MLLSSVTYTINSLVVLRYRRSKTSLLGAIVDIPTIPLYLLLSIKNRVVRSCETVGEQSERARWNRDSVLILLYESRAASVSWSITYRIRASYSARINALRVSYTLPLRSKMLSFFYLRASRGLYPPFLIA